MIKTPIGKVERIRRYPVKSMGGSDIETVYIHETGLNGDRVYALYDYNSERPSLPYLTIRELELLLLLQPRIANEASASEPYSLDYKPQIVIDIENEDMLIEDDRLINYLYGKLNSKMQNLTLDHRKSGIHDTKPISIVSRQSIAKFGEEMELQYLDPLRFRSNFYVTWENNEPFYEEKLVGKSIQIGDEVVLHIVKNNIRCIIINVDPKTAHKDKKIFRTLSMNREAKFGVYAEVRTCGKVNTGDTIYLLS